MLAMGIIHMFSPSASQVHSFKPERRDEDPLSFYISNKDTGLLWEHCFDFLVAQSYLVDGISLSLVEVAFDV